MSTTPATNRSVPSARPSPDPEGLVRTPTDVLTRDGVRLQACWVHAAPMSETVADAGIEPAADDVLHGVVVVIAHGFSASMADTNVQLLVNRLAGRGCRVLVYDARGHGTSGGHSAVGSREHLDVDGVSRLARAAADGAPVVLVGVSMGAVGVVGYLAGPDAGTGPDAGAPCRGASRGDAQGKGDPLTPHRDTPVAGAVLVSAPARWRMRPGPVGILTALMTRSAPGRWAAARWIGVRIEPHWRVGTAPMAQMARIGVPVAVVHGRGDRLLATSHGQDLHSAAEGPCRLDLVADMGHGLGDAAVGGVVEAISWVLGPGTRQRRDREPAPTTTPAR